MKKWIALLLSVTMILSLAACSGSGAGDPAAGTDQATEAAQVTTEAKVSNKELAKETADNFFKCLSEGDIETLKTYCTPEVQDSVGLNELEKSFTESFSPSTSDGEAYVPSEEAKAVLNDAVSTIFKACIEKYEIGEIEGADDQTSYDVPATMYVRSVDSEDTFDTDAVLSESLTEDMVNEMMTIAQDEGENAMYDYMMVNLMPKMFEAMSAVIEAKESEPQEVTITVEEQADGTWLVTSTSGMGSMVPGSENSTEAGAETSTGQ